MEQLEPEHTHEGHRVFCTVNRQDIRLSRATRSDIERLLCTMEHTLTAAGVYAERHGDRFERACQTAAAAEEMKEWIEKFMKRLPVIVGSSSTGARAVLEAHLTKGEALPAWTKEHLQKTLGLTPEQLHALIDALAHRTI